MQVTEQVENYLAQCLRSRNVELSSAETHRHACESCIDNALHHCEFDDETRKRLERLLSSLQAAASATPQRKVDLILHTVIPTLENLPV